VVKSTRLEHAALGRRLACSGRSLLHVESQAAVDFFLVLMLLRRVYTWIWAWLEEVLQSESGKCLVL